MDNYAEKIVASLKNPKESFQELCREFKGNLNLKNNTFTCTARIDKTVKLALRPNGDVVLEDIE